MTFPIFVAAALAVLAPAQGDATPSLADAHRLFFNAHYEQSAAAALSLRAAGPRDLANDELRTSALLFQLRRLLDGQDARDGDKDAAWKACAKTCADLLAAFTADFQQGRAAAQAILKANPKDETALFYLGKLDLNYVWLQLGLLGKKTGWDEYWEARRSLDAVLKANPAHVRARVARAWIDYIVNTRMPWGTRWLLGGGNKKKALAALRQAAAATTDWMSHAEAEFALWDMLVREKNLPQAGDVARRIARDFPENAEVAAFLKRHRI
jgi:tetratricopeptide (TPR) repeat protein